MTHNELAEVLMEIEGQRRALADNGYVDIAEVLRNKIGRLCSEHILEVVSSLKFWDAPLSLTKELITEVIDQKRPRFPTKEEIEQLQCTDR